ncbi:uncharacterized protein B0T15DRAFT_30119 [Chaetomium strumarium]|uniref:Uncharacterized protein n=1 Tax=Chaetomium strumarium TaxID=1170767 RepID=A0AAJ0H1Q9_9PEZI|nr:hypothetical protein B0T15DRAFT_30119 [Chaetomium strumarium]
MIFQPATVLARVRSLMVFLAHPPGAEPSFVHVIPECHCGQCLGGSNLRCSSHEEQRGITLGPSSPCHTKNTGNQSSFAMNNGAKKALGRVGVTAVLQPQQGKPARHDIHKRLRQLAMQCRRQRSVRPQSDLGGDVGPRRGWRIGVRPASSTRTATRRSWLPT